MNGTSNKKNALQRLANERVFWDLFLGPIYNRMTPRALKEAYGKIADMVSPEAGSHLLDVGCGPGDVPLMLAERYPETLFNGVDYSMTEVRAADRLLSKKGLGNCVFTQADVIDMPFAGGSFDLVMSFASIKHWHDKEQGLREIKRVLKPGGTALVGEADRDASDEAVARFTDCYHSWYVYRRLFDWYARLITIEQGMTYGEIEDIALSAGFKGVRRVGLDGWPFVITELKN